MKRLRHLLPAVFAAATSFAAAPNADWSPNLTTVTAWHWNISNGGAVWDRIGTLQLGADVLSSSEYQIGRYDSVHPSLHFGGDWFPRFKALNRGIGGARLDWQHRFGDSPRATLFTLEGEVDAVYPVESARRGTLTAINVRLAQRFGRTWRAAVTQRFEDFAAKGAVFDRRSTETIAEIARDFGSLTRVTLTGRWREGDVVTYAQFRRPDLQAVAHTMARLDTFRLPMTAYATEARTIAGRIAVVHATAEDTAVSLSYEYSMSSKGDLKFQNPVLALSYVIQY